MTKIRLEKLLSNYGFCSRSVAKVREFDDVILIWQNYIKRNKVTDLSGKPLHAEEDVDPSQILIKGVTIDYISPYLVLSHSY